MEVKETKTRASMIYNVVESVILAMSVMLICWVAMTVIDQGKSLASHATMLDVNSTRLMNLEQFGSRNLGEHEKLDDTRVADIQKRIEKLEQAVLALQNTPSRLDSVQAALARIERILEEHMRERKGPQ